MKKLLFFAVIFALSIMTYSCTDDDSVETEMNRLEHIEKAGGEDGQTPDDDDE